MDARDQRALVTGNRSEAVEEVPARPREENPVESDNEESAILEERDQFPLRIHIPDARGRSDPPAAEVLAAIDSGM